MTVSYVGNSTLAASTDTATPFGTISVTAPTRAVDDLLLMVMGLKPFSTDPGDDADFTPLVSRASGSVAMGNGTGSTRVKVWSRVATNTATDNIAIPFTAQYSPTMHHMLCFRKTEAGAWTVEATSGADATATGTSFSATADDTLNLEVGDFIVAVAMTPDDFGVGTGVTSLALSVPGCTLSPTTITNLETTTGNDATLVVMRAEVTAGSASGPATLTFDTETGDSHGAVAFIRVAEPSGVTEVTGHAQGDVAAVGAATGLRTVQGQVAGSVVAAATAAGVRTVVGHAQGTVAAVGVATGQILGPVEGSGLGSVAAVGTATGVRTVFGHAQGDVAAVGAATGRPVKVGHAQGTVAAVGQASGIRTVVGHAQGDVAAVGHAVGQTAGTAIGSGLGAVAAVGSATGIRTVTGSGLGAVAAVGTATGRPVKVGAALGAVAAIGAASGLVVRVGHAQGAVAALATAAGVRTVFGHAQGDVAAIGVALGILGEQPVAPPTRTYRVPGRQIERVSRSSLHGVYSGRRIYRPTGPDRVASAP